MIRNHIAFAGIYPSIMLVATFLIKTINYIDYLIKDAKDIAQRNANTQKASTSP